MSAAVAATMPSLFPYFGNKRKVASLVWARLGNVSNYVEPFAGSAAVLLRRPEEHEWWTRTETINDADCYIANFWKALAAEPDEVARLAAGWPVNEALLTSVHLHLVQQRTQMTERIMADPFYYDVQVAAWWLWGVCQYIGADWTSGIGPYTGGRGPSISNGGTEPGVYRKTPMIGGGHPGKGIHRRRRGLTRDLLTSTVEEVAKDAVTIANRLRNVRVACGDWSRVVGQAAEPNRGHFTGIFLDPPYDPSERRSDLYAVESTRTQPVHEEVRTWALAHGEDTNKRIVYCGYSTPTEDDLFRQAGWTPIRWKAAGGYGLVGDNRARGNAAREIMWCSPNCLAEPDETMSLF